MKKFISEYIHIISTTLIVVLFGLSFFYILLNAYHYSTMATTIYVSKDNSNIKLYKTNIDKVTEIINNQDVQLKQGRNKEDYLKLNIKLKNIVGLLKNTEVVSLYNIEGDTYLNYYDLYQLNDTYISKIIDGSYIINLRSLLEDDNIVDRTIIEKIKSYESYFDIETSSAKYIKAELKDNSSYYYNTYVSSSSIRNPMDSNYDLIIKNHVEFSEVLLDLLSYYVEVSTNE